MIFAGIETPPESQTPEVGDDASFTCLTSGGQGTVEFLVSRTDTTDTLTASKPCMLLEEMLFRFSKLYPC